jgi:hypothetical protein
MENRATGQRLPRARGPPYRSCTIVGGPPFAILFFAKGGSALRLGSLVAPLAVYRQAGGPDDKS